MGSEIVDLGVQVVRFVADYHPGIVACEFIDADSRRHTLIDKAPIFSSEPLDAQTSYPQPGAVRCAMSSQWIDASGREVVRVNTVDPDCVASAEGCNDFVVLRTQVTPLTGRTP